MCAHTFVDLFVPLFHCSTVPLFHCSTVPLFTLFTLLGERTQCPFCASNLDFLEAKNRYKITSLHKTNVRFVSVLCY